MKKLVTAFATAALFAAGASGVAAQGLEVGPTIAFSDEVDFGIGVTGSKAAPSLGEGIGFLGEILIFFPSQDGFSYFEINANVTYDFPLEDSSVMPFVLGGLNFARASFDAGGLGSASSTDIGLNLGGGIAFDAGSFRPSAGARFTIGDFDQIIFFLTLPFQVGSN